LPLSSYYRSLTDKSTQEERTLPPLSPTDVHVAVHATGLCGSDLHYFNHYRNGDIIVQEPLTLGHESAGTITAVGSEVTSLRVGDHVALEVGQPCEQCGLCLEGRYNICSGMRFRSSAKAFPHAQGTLQEVISHPAKWCHKYVYLQAIPFLQQMEKRGYTTNTRHQTPSIRIPRPRRPL